MMPFEDRALMRFALSESWPDSPTSREKDCYRHIQSDSMRYEKPLEGRQAGKLKGKQADGEKEERFSKFFFSFDRI